MKFIYSELPFLSIKICLSKFLIFSSFIYSRYAKVASLYKSKLFFENFFPTDIFITIYMKFFTSFFIFTYCWFCSSFASSFIDCRTAENSGTSMMTFLRQYSTVSTLKLLCLISFSSSFKRESTIFVTTLMRSRVDFRSLFPAISAKVWDYLYFLQKTMKDFLWIDVVNTSSRSAKLSSSIIRYFLISFFSYL